MLRYRSPRTYSGVLSLLMLSIYMLLVVPTLAHTGNLESGKEELQLRDLEPKLETETGMLSEHGSGPSISRFSSNRRNQRSFGFTPKLFSIPRSKLPIELGILVDTDDGERPKRFDDYGHMRFGKRGGDEQFDDYGHMRFGR
ncbi:drosulfakinins [Drosophila albomicans]|uniref:Drosulfakinins n=1 Tax=Drosophila albomicans TaxID=7291 RepID=A0A6P8XNX5_DROAB|nr:drosulfakinins [Drosophila albomicans]